MLKHAVSNNSESAKCQCQFYFPVYSEKQINKDFLVLHVQFMTVYQLYTSFSCWKCIRYDTDKSYHTVIADWKEC